MHDVTEKRFITAGELLQDSYLLAHEVLVSGFRPDFIIGIWRGGTPVAIAVQEYLCYHGIDSDHIAIRTSAYTGIDEQAPEVSVHGLEYVIERLHAACQLLLVDDVFDTGRSIAAVIRELSASLGPQMPEVRKIACPWYKPARNTTDLQPDYFIHETGQWLVFPHELQGLSRAEIASGKRDLAAVLDRLDFSAR